MTAVDQPIGGIDYANNTLLPVRTIEAWMGSPAPRAIPKYYDDTAMIPRDTLRDLEAK
jgi:hypothetical protein